MEMDLPLLVVIHRKTDFLFCVLTYQHTLTTAITVRAVNTYSPMPFLCPLQHRQHLHDGFSVRLIT